VEKCKVAQREQLPRIGMPSTMQRTTKRGLSTDRQAARFVPKSRSPFFERIAIFLGLRSLPIRPTLPRFRLTADVLAVFAVTKMMVADHRQTLSHWVFSGCLGRERMEVLPAVGILLVGSRMGTLLTSIQQTGLRNELRREIQTRRNQNVGGSPPHNIVLPTDRHSRDWSRT
jgi:hypothetical protein